MGRSIEVAGIYGRLVAARVRADWQYPTSTILFTLGQFLAAVMDFAAILVLFSRVPALAGWSLYQVLFLYGTAGLSFGLGDLFVSPVEMAATHIKAGSFDQFLLRPVGPLLQLTCEEFAMRRAGKLIQPAATLGIALARLPVVWSDAKVAELVVTIASGTAILSGLWIMTSSLAFWTVETQEVANAFTYGGSFATQYPLDVLGAWLRRLLLFVPLAFINYLPATWLLGRPDALGLPGWARFTSPAVGATTLLAAALIWRSAIRHYRSTGS
jgi:ABC-2 type transport system permease protein